MTGRLLRALGRLALLLGKLVLALLAGIYLLVVRSFLFLLTAGMLLYFASGTSAVRHLVQDVVAPTIPGHITVASLQWGPFPGTIRVADVSIKGEHAEDVITADGVEVEVDLPRIFAGLVAKLADPDRPLALPFRSARVVRPRVYIRVDDDGHVGIERAFHTPDGEPSDDTSAAMDLSIAQARVDDAFVVIDTPEVHLDISGVDVRSPFRVRDHPWMRFVVPRFTVARCDVDLKPAVRPGARLGRLRVPVRDIDVRQVTWEGMAFGFRSLSGSLPGGGSLSGRGDMDLSGERITWSAAATTRLAPGSPLLERLTDGLLRGSVELSIDGRGDLDEVAAWTTLDSEHLTVAGFPARRAHAAFGLEPVITPDGRLTHRFSIREAHASVFGGRLLVGPGAWLPRWAERQPDGPPRPTLNDFHAEVLLEGVEPLALLAAPWMALVPDDLGLLRGALHGRLSVAGSVDEETGLFHASGRTPELEMGALDAPGLPLGDHYALRGGFELTAGPAGSVSPQSGRFHPVARLALDDVELRSRGDHLAVDGLVDLERGTLDTRVDLRIADLAAFLEPFDLSGVAGDLRLRQAEVTGRFLDPSIRGGLRVDRAFVGGQSLGVVTAEIDLGSGELAVANLDARTPYGHVGATGRVRLWDEDLTRPHPRMPFRLREASITGLDLHALAPSLGIEAILDVQGRDIAAEATDPVSTLSGRASLSTGPVRFGGERARSVSADLRGDTRRLAAEGVRIVMDSGDVVRGAVALDKRTRQLEAQVVTRGLPFDAFDWFAEQDLPFSGRVSADLSLEGTLDAPAIIGTIRVRDLGFDPVVLGDATLTLTPGPGGRVDISTTESFPGLELLDGSFVELDGGEPSRIVVRARGEDVDVFERIPFLAVPDTTLIATGIVELEVWLDRDPTEWEVRVDALPDDVKLGLYDGEVGYTNLSPAYLVVDGDGIHLGPVTVGTNLDDTLTMCGRLGVEGDMDLQVTGRSDLEAAHPLRELFSVYEGEVRVGPDPQTTAQLGDDGCLPDPGDRVLHLTGSMARPIASGRIELVDTRLLPRGFGYEIRLDDRAGVLLRPGRDGRIRLIFPRDPEERFAGEVDDGGFGLWGELILDGITPERADLHLVGADLFYSSAGQYRLTFNPEIRLTVRDFSSEERRRLVLSGDVLVTEGSFYKSFDRLSQTLTGGATTTGSSVPLTEEIPWLADLTLDLDVTSSDFQVRSKFPFGDTDLDIRIDVAVEGTLDELRVHDRVQLVPGGRVAYDVISREFEIVQGVLDFEGDPFAPYVNIEARTEVTYLALVDPSLPDSEEERHVTVSLRISGVPPALNLEYWSNDDPSLDQADLQSLILTGRPRDEAAQSRGGFGFQYDFGSALQDILQSPIIEALRVRVGADQSVTTELINRLGRVVRLRTRVVQETEETRVTAGFRFQITDQLSLEGNLQRVENATNPTQTYQARFKYRIPLD